MSIDSDPHPTLAQGTGVHPPQQNTKHLHKIYINLWGDTPTPSICFGLLLAYANAKCN